MSYSGVILACERGLANLLVKVFCYALHLFTVVTMGAEMRALVLELWEAIIDTLFDTGHVIDCSYPP